MPKGNSREVWPPAYLVSDLRGRYYLWDGAGSTGRVVPAPSHGVYLTLFYLEYFIPSKTFHFIKSISSIQNVSSYQEHFILLKAFHFTDSILSRISYCTKSILYTFFPILIMLLIPLLCILFYLKYLILSRTSHLNIVRLFFISPLGIL